MRAAMVMASLRLAVATESHVAKSAGAAEHASACACEAAQVIADVGRARASLPACAGWSVFADSTGYSCMRGAGGRLIQLCKRRRRHAPLGVRFARRGDQSGEKHLCSSHGRCCSPRRAGEAAAQEVLSAPPHGGAGDLPPDMGFADDACRSGDRRRIGRRRRGELIQPMPEARRRTIEGIFGTLRRRPDAAATARARRCFESSGTWLRRGFWYAEGDYMLMNRSWDRKGLLFAFEGGVEHGARASSPGSATPGFGPVLALNTLIIDGSKPGADGMARVTLGRFLFRDAAQSRPQRPGHVLRRRQLEAELERRRGDRRRPAGQRLHRPRQPVVRRRRAAWRFDYETGLDSVEDELHRQVAHGPRPDGAAARRRVGARRRNTSQTYSFLAGLRYVKLTDVLNIDADAQSGRRPRRRAASTSSIRDNDLFGGQLGVSVAHETARWSIGLTVKGGSFWNRMNLDSQFVAGPRPSPSRGGDRHDRGQPVVRRRVPGARQVAPAAESVAAGRLRGPVRRLDRPGAASGQLRPRRLSADRRRRRRRLLGSSLGIEAYR